MDSFITITTFDIVIIVEKEVCCSNKVSSSKGIMKRLLVLMFSHDNNSSLECWVEPINMLNFYLKPKLGVNNYGGVIDFLGRELHLQFLNQLVNART